MKYFLLFNLFIGGQYVWSAQPSETTNDPQPHLTGAIRIKSEEIRSKKKVTLTGEVIGQGPSGAYGQGLNFGYFFTDNSLLMVELNGGRSSIGSTSYSSNTDWDQQEIKSGFSAGVAFKHFLANSFYFKSGLDFRTFQFKHVKNDWLGTNPSISRKFSGDSIAASFSIGNQWQFDYFTMGCDWFGVEAPLLSKIYDVEYSSSADGTDRYDNRKDINRYVTGLGVTFLRFYLGASF